jgi:PEGA domain
MVCNFYQFLSQPTNQPIAVGASPVQFQLATSNSTSSWNYLGPDGTAGTYYNATTTDISSVNNGNRYLRYRMMLSTASSSYTPSVSDIQFTFTSSCVPPGQVLFQSLPTGTYTITVSKAGYTTTNDSVTVTAGSWQEKQINIGL